ncbi:TlpA family protein disulfide reductase [Ekhidna sp. To15]|uniref:TlpA family protein disulfide reductase n=1 Tax=Ekhidna sp. To15 TaxID=3395267 RepID=UPI003F5224E8
MKQKVKKELIEWIVLITVFGIIYLTGWHTEVIGRVQQVVLATGFITPEMPEEERKASYDFWLEDFEGNRVQFAEFEGEVVFLNFWATWCPPCVAEMPDIHDLYDKQKNDVKFVMISLDQDESKAHAFINRKGFEFPVYFLRSALPGTYNTRSIPTTYVMNKEGLIKVENHGMAKYDTESFNELLKDLSKAQ